MINQTLAVLVAVLAIAACGTTPLPAGAECTQTSDCESSLSCLEVAQFSGTTCTVVDHACSITCTGTTDTACQTLGPNFTCFAGCGSAMTCGTTAAP